MLLTGSKGDLRVSGFMQGMCIQKLAIEETQSTICELKQCRSARSSINTLKDWANPSSDSWVASMYAGQA
jgi:hypothetical protein